jgi:hypothetical protein
MAVRTLKVASAVHDRLKSRDHSVAVLFFPLSSGVLLMQRIGLSIRLAQVAPQQGAFWYFFHLAFYCPAARSIARDSELDP